MLRTWATETFTCPALSGAGSLLHRHADVLLLVPLGPRRQSLVPAAPARDVTRRHLVVRADASGNAPLHVHDPGSDAILALCQPARV